MTVDWSTWRPRLLYTAFFLAALLLALRQTLPVEAVKERLILEASQRGWQVDAGEVGPAGLIGVGLKDVTLKDKAGLSIPIDRLDVSFPLWPLLTGKRRVALSARLYDGTARGTYDLAGAQPALDLALDKLDLSQAIPLRKASGLDLAGVVSGTAHVVMGTDEKAKAEGRADLSVAAAGVTGGRVFGMSVPKVSLGDLTAVLKIAAGKATFEKLGTAGGDIDVTGDGLSVVLQPRLEYAQLFGRISFKTSDGFATRPDTKTLKVALDGVLGGARSPGGAYALQVFGTLGHPQVQPLAGGLPGQ